MSALSLVCCRASSRGREHPDLAVVDLRPSQLAMYAMVGIQCQSARQSFDLNVGCAALHGGGHAIGIEAEGEQTVAAGTATVGIGALQGAAHGVRKLTA